MIFVAYPDSGARLVPTLLDVWPSRLSVDRDAKRRKRDLLSRNINGEYQGLLPNPLKTNFNDVPFKSILVLQGYRWTFQI